jgi:uncharacterized protein (TIGR02421 family)
VRRTLPVWGRIHIDRQLPFLCAYRRPVKGNDVGTERLVTSEASYVICSGQKRLQPQITDLVRAVAETLVEQFGACLLLELWAAPPRLTEGPVTTAELHPQFRLAAAKEVSTNAVTDDLEDALTRLKLSGKKATVTRVTTAKCSPKTLSPILSTAMAAEIGCLVYGLEITPIYRDAENGEIFPGVLRQFRRSLTIALRRAFFEFARKHTTHRPAHFHSLGRRAVVKAVWEVDRLLAQVSDQFDFLLQLTPVNGESAWQEFRRTQYDRKPAFHYRPMPAEPVELKRNLYRAPVERVEDPALAQIFREKIDELDRQITMLQDRNTHRGLYESLQLFGGVEDALFDLAVEILEKVPSRSRDESTKGQLTPQQFAQRASDEIGLLRQRFPEITATVDVRPDVTGLMVSQGDLLIGSALRVPPSRVDALLQHEVGTHVLTYHNGRAQPLRQLYSGLAGYDALQEGLAVLTEYLVGGLSRPRLRLLAARVVAARRLIEGASFIDAYRELDRNYDFARRTAFIVAMRTFRGGGLTKDAVYLRGLCQILEYLGKGGELEPLFVGKIAVTHIPIVRELRYRGVLREPPLVPRYMGQPDALARLERLRGGMSVLDLISTSRK